MVIWPPPENTIFGRFEWFKYSKKGFFWWNQKGWNQPLGWSLAYLWMRWGKNVISSPLFNSDFWAFQPKIIFWFFKNIFSLKSGKSLNRNHVWFFLEKKKKHNPDLTEANGEQLLSINGMMKNTKLFQWRSSSSNNVHTLIWSSVKNLNYIFCLQKSLNVFLSIQRSIYSSSSLYPWFT